MQKINDEKLRNYFEWFRKQQQELRQLLAARCALRVWPFVIDPRIWETNRSELQKQVVFNSAQSLFVSFSGTVDQEAARKFPMGQEDCLRGHEKAGVSNDLSRVAFHASCRSSYDSIAAKACGGDYEEFIIIAALAASGHPECLELWWNGANRDHYGHEFKEKMRAPQVKRIFEVESCLYEDQKISPTQLTVSTLWLNSAIPFELNFRSSNDTLLAKFKELEFFKDWYQGFLDGKPLDRDLQVRVAQIDTDIWRAGPSALAEEIAFIRAKLGLEKQIEILELGRDALMAGISRYGIGGNNPPEHMSIELQLVKETTALWAAVDELKIVTQMEHPDKSLVLRLIETLGRALKAILAWCGRKGDLSVDQIIRWGVPIGVCMSFPIQSLSRKLSKRQRTCFRSFRRGT